MGLLFTSKVDRDFAGGIYLDPFGMPPALDLIDTVGYLGDLYLPLASGYGPPMHLVVDIGTHVQGNTLLARGGLGQRLYAPCAGTLVAESTACVQTRPDRPVVIFDPQPDPAVSSQAQVSAPAISQVTPEQAQREQVWQRIENAGVVLPHNGEPLALMLKRLDTQAIMTVVANATPIEPSLNGPLALLQQRPDQVFAGLAILKQWLGAEQAVMAYPHLVPIDHAVADQWQVRCAPVSEKYPQGRAGSVLRTLKRQGFLPRRPRDPLRSTVVFDIQLLRQVERLILAGKLPTERIVTVAGDGVERPGHYLVTVGLPLKELLAHAGVRPDAQCVADGTSMDGVAVNPNDVVIAQTSHFFTVAQRVPRRRPQACIRCGWCINDCPAGLDPARLIQLAESGQYEQAVELNLDRCIECGICSGICPSNLRIAENIRMMKHKLQAETESAAHPETEFTLQTETELAP